MITALQNLINDWNNKIEILKNKRAATKNVISRTVYLATYFQLQRDISDLKRLLSNEIINNIDNIEYIPSTHLKILKSTQAFTNQINRLRTLAPDYPKVYFEEADNCEWITTMVEFEYEKKRYKRHHVESVIKNQKYNTQYLYERLITNAELSINFGKPYYLDTLIS